jgi:CubicO group peptidase (beta-lactamase class C family)
MFQAGSISKPLAAMAALRLVEQGKLSLDADVNTFLTTWKFPADPVAVGKPVTLRELLTHTGGTTVHGFPGYASTEFPKDEKGPASKLILHQNGRDMTGKRLEFHR